MQNVAEKKRNASRTRAQVKDPEGATGGKTCTEFVREYKGPLLRLGTGNESWGTGDDVEGTEGLVA